MSKKGRFQGILPSKRGFQKPSEKGSQKGPKMGLLKVKQPKNSKKGVKMGRKIAKKARFPPVFKVKWLKTPKNDSF